MQKNILVFSGSIREHSVNKKLAFASQVMAAQAGANSTFVDLAQYPAPIYNGDDEARDGLPDSIKSLKQIMAKNDGFIVVSPEYNGHVPPLLVNTFSWLSRADEGEQGMVAFKGKIAAIMAASPGRLGGIRVLPRLRDMLAELGVMVVPGFVTLPDAAQAFNNKGELHDGKNIQSVTTLVHRLLAA